LPAGIPARIDGDPNYVRAKSPSPFPKTASRPRGLEGRHRRRALSGSSGIGAGGGLGGTIINPAKNSFDEPDQGGVGRGSARHCSRSAYLRTCRRRGQLTKNAKMADYLVPMFRFVGNAGYRFLLWPWCCSPTLWEERAVGAPKGAGEAGTSWGRRPAAPTRSI